MSNTNLNNIHWFPGHMKKAINQIEEKVKTVDVIVEIVDARCPISSLNPMLEEKIKNKPRLLVLSKSDLADPKTFSPYDNYFSNLGYKVIIGSLKDAKFSKNIADSIMLLGKDKQDKFISKGMKPQPIKTMVIGVPNVGKSTLINKLAKRSAAGVENRPGYTRAQQWIKVNNFYLLDTPGILPANYEDKNTATKLALVGSIKEEILPVDVLFDELVNFLRDNYKESLKDRFGINDFQDLDNYQVSSLIAERRGLKRNDAYDVDKAKVLLLKEFKDGLLGRISLDIL